MDRLVFGFLLLLKVNTAIGRRIGLLKDLVLVKGYSVFFVFSIEHVSKLIVIFCALFLKTTHCLIKFAILFILVRRGG